MIRLLSFQIGLILGVLLVAQSSFAQTLYQPSKFDRVELNIFSALHDYQGEAVPMDEQILIAQTLRLSFLFGFQPKIIVQTPKAKFEFYQDKYGRPQFDQNYSEIQIAVSPHIYQGEEHLLKDFWHVLMLQQKIQNIRLEISQDHIPVVANQALELFGQLSEEEKSKHFLRFLLRQYSKYNNDWMPAACVGIYRPY